MSNQTRIIQLISTDGFMSAFWDIVPNTTTHAEAYEQLETEYHSYFGRNRYSSFESFRICRDYRNKRGNEIEEIFFKKKLNVQQTQSLAIRINLFVV